MERIKQSLNGSWNYSVNDCSKGLIDVPFSSLCVGHSSCSVKFDRSSSLPRCFLCFEGITYQATVYLNGTLIGKMVPYSFYSFDITNNVKKTDNVLTVELEDMNIAFGPSEGWENYGGIIRDVYLEYTDYVKIDDFIWRTTISSDHAVAQAEIEVFLDGGDKETIATLKDASGFIVTSSKKETIGGKALLQLTLNHPLLWSPDFPYLYTLTVETNDDSISQKVGFKDFRTQGQRFILNGSPLFLKGICRHDMWGDQGHTLTEAQMQKDMRMIKATGCNFVRLVHYPHNRRILEIADEIGLLVSEEPGLWWSDMHNPEIVAGALEVMGRVVKRDRNHVSVAFWLCFNECIFTPEFLQQSSALCRQLDPTRLVSGANCMSLEKTKEEFIRNGFDFYTMHPYGLELDHVGTRPNRSGKLDEVLDLLNDKPLLFTEWGGLFVYENPKLFARFLTYMQNAWKNPDGGRVLAGCCYWVWADMYEFGRGEHACFDGILHEGLVDIYRNARLNLDVFSKLMHGMEFEKEPQKDIMIMPFNSANPESLSPINIWENKSAEEQTQLYKKVLEDATPQAGYYHKKLRRLTNGPSLPQKISLIGNIPVEIPKGNPLVIIKEESIEIGKKVESLLFWGNVSLPYGYPAYGERGEKAAEYVLEYLDGTSEVIPIRNGIELTTALGLIGPSRIIPIAANAKTAIRFSYDLNWEHYYINSFELHADSGRVLSRVRIRVVNANYKLLLYGLTVRIA